MGQELQFSFSKAIKAGLETKLDVINYDDGEGEQLQKLMHVPGRMVYNEKQEFVNVAVYLDIFEVNGVLIASVTANIWGDTYRYLTDWLDRNDIEWELL